MVYNPTNRIPKSYLGFTMMVYNPANRIPKSYLGFTMMRRLLVASHTNAKWVSSYPIGLKVNGLRVGQQVQK